MTDKDIKHNPGPWEASEMSDEAVFPFQDVSDGSSDLSSIAEMFKEHRDYVAQKMLKAFPGQRFLDSSGFDVQTGLYVSRDQREGFEEVCDGKREKGGTFDRLLTSARALSDWYDNPLPVPLADLFRHSARYGWALKELFDSYEDTHGEQVLDPDDLRLGMIPREYP